MHKNNTNNTRMWKNAGIFNSYENALKKKQELILENYLVKIRRAGIGGLVFKVKYSKEEFKSSNKKSNKKRKK